MINLSFFRQDRRDPQDNISHKEALSKPAQRGDGVL
jgi:hypothetical protein